LTCMVWLRLDLAQILQQTGPHRKPHQLRKAAPLLLVYHGDPIHFNGSRTDVVVAGDHLVRESRDKPFHDLTFAGTETVDATGNVPGDRFIFRSRSSWGDRGFGHPDQAVVFERLFKKIDGSELHRLDGEGDIAMPGDDHDRK